jgi:hypothetical protein
VDEKRIDLKAALRELAAEESESGGPHVGLKRLIAYREGTLPTAESEALQEHLSRCARCTRLLRELRDFEAASAGGETGPESLRQEAWDSLIQRLAPQKPEVRPIAGVFQRQAPRLGRFRYAVYGVEAALLLAILGLSVWAAVTVQQERRRVAQLEQRLAEREEALAAARRSLANAERQLAAARGRIQSREKEKVDQPSREDAPLAGGGRSNEHADRVVVASHDVEVSVAPRFALRGQENLEGGFLRGGGAVNTVRVARPADRFTVAMSLADHPIYGEYRFELRDRNGQVLWAGRRPGRSLLGDRGTSVSVSGIDPGMYRLRVEGLRENRGELLAEYVLAVERQETPQ